MTAEPLAVIGAGTMGTGIAYVAAMGGFEVRLVDADPDQLRRAIEELRRMLDDGVERGELTTAEAERAAARISPAEDIPSGADSAVLVIEAVVEDLATKQKVLRTAAEIAPSAILATNTSALSVTALAAVLPDPSQAVGMHFFNPVPKMKLCELVLPLQAGGRTVGVARRAAERMGKEVVVVADRPGFATSRINALLGNEAFRMLEESVASPEGIDTAIRVGLNHPMGPLEMGDLVGLDVRLAVLEHLAATLGERFRPTNLHRSLVDAGRLGRKSGQGVYQYSEDGSRMREPSDLGLPALPAERD